MGRGFFVGAVVVVSALEAAGAWTVVRFEPRRGPPPKRFLVGFVSVSDAAVVVEDSSLFSSVSSLGASVEGLLRPPLSRDGLVGRGFRDTVVLFDGTLVVVVDVVVVLLRDPPEGLGGRVRRFPIPFLGDASVVDVVEGSSVVVVVVVEVVVDVVTVEVEEINAGWPEGTETASELSRAPDGATIWSVSADSPTAATEMFYSKLKGTRFKIGLGRD